MTNNENGSNFQPEGFDNTNNVTPSFIQDTPVQQPYVPNEFNSNSFYGSFDSNQGKAKMPGKSRKKKIILSIVGGIAALAATTGIAYAASGTFRNFVDKTFLSADAYFHKVESRAFSNVVSDYVDTYEATYEKVQSGSYSSNVGLKFELSDAANELLNQTIPDFSEIGTLNSAEIDITAGVDDNSMLGGYTTKINDVDFITANLYSDFANSEIYMQIPELLSEYIKIPTNSPSDASPEFSELMSTIRDMYPEPDALKDILNRYGDVVIDSIENVEMSSNAIDAGGVTQSVTVLTAKLGGEELCNILVNIINEMKEDEAAVSYLDFIVKNMGQTEGIQITSGKQFLELMSAGLNMGKTQLAAYKDIITLEVYVDSVGDVVGHKIIVDPSSLMPASPDMNKQIVELTYITAHSGNEVGCEVSFSTPAASGKFAGKGTKDGDAITGDYNLSFTDENGQTANIAHIKTKDFVMSTKESKGELTLSSEAIPGGELKLTIDANSESASMVGELMYNGTNFGSLTLTSKTSSASFTKPDVSNAVDGDSLSDDDFGGRFENYIKEFEAKSGFKLFSSFGDKLDSLYDSTDELYPSDFDYDLDDDYDLDYDDDLDNEYDYDDVGLDDEYNSGDDNDLDDTSDITGSYDYADVYYLCEMSDGETTFDEEVLSASGLADQYVVKINSDGSTLLNFGESLEGNWDGSNFVSAGESIPMTLDGDKITIKAENYTMVFKLK